MPMLISDDPRARSFSKREYWRGYKWGVLTTWSLFIAILVIYHYWG